MSLVRKSTILAVATTLTTPTLLQAEEADVIITASRTAETYNETLASVTVITRQDIESSQANSLQDLLTGHSSLDIRQSGGLGKVSSLFLRGTNTSHTLFLVDGIKLGSASLGTTSFQHIPLQQIERIEIVRGPRSSLYGSEAIGGVVQIFTRKGTEEHQAQVDLGTGSDGLREAAVSTSGSFTNTRYALNIARQKTDGIDALQDIEPDEDGYDNKSIGVNISHQYANGTELQASVMHTEGETEYDGTWSNNSDFIQQTASLKLGHNITDNWYSSLTLGGSKDEDHSFLDATHASLFTTKRKQASWQNDLALNERNLMTLGVDYQHDDVGKENDFTEHQRENTGVFIQHQANLGNSEITASLRNDHNESFGSHTTGSLALGHKLGNTQLYASYGTAFKAPTFNDLYYPWGGNPDLEPEESTSIELGVRSSHSWGSIEANLYQTDIDKLINWICVSGCDSFGVWEPRNIDETEIKGAEFIVTAEILGWQTSTALSWVDPTNKKTGKTLAHRAEETAKLGVHRKFQKLTLGMSLLAQSGRYIDQTNSDQTAGYGVVDLRAAWDVNQQLQIKGKVDNATDKEYETSPGYNTAERTYFVGLSYKMK